MQFSKGDSYFNSTSFPKALKGISLIVVHPHRPKSKTAAWRSVNRDRPNFLLEDDVSRMSTRTSTAEVSDHSLGDSCDNGHVASRTFRSVIELRNRPCEKSPSDFEKFKNFQHDFVECFPEVKSDIMKHQKHEAGFELIMDVNFSDLVKKIPVRTFSCLLVPFPCYFLSKWATIYLDVPAYFSFFGAYLSIYVIHKYLSSICIIKMNQNTSTYAAEFPFRGIKRVVKFRKNHVRKLTSSFYQSNHATIKGQVVTCPRSCFIKTHHHDELFCQTHKSNEIRTRS